MSSPTGNPALADTAWLDKFGLNPRQRAFVLAYIADPNAKQAATDAGYAEGSAEAQGSRLLSNI
ncbi:terminase small subunit [uncultured Ruegeria sp.]|uniref:terminase small subunit n=1 Tax=uncultured Ruegeria sp. TaxID=259304 RepID=UPI00261F0200|nr:terminase small subunit [uncultured Ruegeria sp.]